MSRCWRSAPSSAQVLRNTIQTSGSAGIQRLVMFEVIIRVLLSHCWTRALSRPVRSLIASSGLIRDERWPVPEPPPAARVPYSKSTWLENPCVTWPASFPKIAIELGAFRGRALFLFLRRTVPAALCLRIKSPWLSRTLQLLGPIRVKFRSHVL